MQADDIAARSKACTDAGKPEINVQVFTLQSDVTTALTSGKVDAMLADSPVVAYAIQQTGGESLSRSATSTTRRRTASWCRSTSSRSPRPCRRPCRP